MCQTIFQVVHLQSQSKIEQFGFEIRSDQDIGGFQVAMEKTVLVQKLNSQNHFLHQIDFLAQHQRTCHLGERTSFQIFHHEMRHLVRLAEVVDVDNVGMAELCHCAGLMHETCPQCGMVQILGFESLDRDFAP